MSIRTFVRGYCRVLIYHYKHYLLVIGALLTLIAIVPSLQYILSSGNTQSSVISHTYMVNLIRSLLLSYDPLLLASLSVAFTLSIAQEERSGKILEYIVVASLLRTQETILARAVSIYLIMLAPGITSIILQYVLLTIFTDTALNLVLATSIAISCILILGTTSITSLLAFLIPRRYSHIITYAIPLIVLVVQQSTIYYVFKMGVKSVFLINFILPILLISVGIALIGLTYLLSKIYIEKITVNIVTF